MKILNSWNCFSYTGTLLKKTIKDSQGVPEKESFGIYQQDNKGGIDLEKVNVGRGSAESSIKINFANDPAMMEKLRNSTGLRVIIGDIIPMTPPAINHLLGLNADGSENKSADSGQSAEQLAVLKEE